MKATLLHPYASPLDWKTLGALREVLTDGENDTAHELDDLRYELRWSAQQADRADPLKNAILNRYSLTKDMRRRRANALGCEDWFRRADGKLAGQMLLPL